MQRKPQIRELKKMCQLHRYNAYVEDEEREAEIDGRTAWDSGFHGKWANMCKDCHELFGVGLGTGKGHPIAQ